MPDVTLSVPIGRTPYSVEISSGLLRRGGLRVRDLAKTRRVTVITDDRVAKLHAPGLCEGLERAGIGYTLIAIPSGEPSKCAETLAEIHDVLAADHHDRTEPIIALGGGVVSDVAGFAAATWMRGVPWIVCPTTFEAMIDAAIGGKTGINHLAGKNLIGAFHQPLAVLIDPLCAATLPQRDYVAGLAESVKHTLLVAEDFLEWHEQNAEPIRAKDPDILPDLIRRNCEIKIAVVVADEREQDSASVGRAALNLGHTIGHAVESLTDFELRHGEAVAIGLVAEMELAVRGCGFSGQSRARIEALLTQLGLPTKMPRPFEDTEVLRRLGSDKKVHAGQVRFVVPTQIGELAWLASPSTSDLTAALSRIR